MRFKRIMIVTFILLAILTIESVSASEGNLTSDNLEVSEDVNVSYVDGNVLKDAPGSFSDLSGLIESIPEGNILELDKNYQYDEAFGENGISITKSLTIDGKGHTLDANASSRIFNINANNVLLKNIIFKNGNFTDFGDGAAVSVYGNNNSIDNCSFINIMGSGAVIFNKGYSLNFKYYIKNCKFENCSKGSCVGVEDNIEKSYSDLYVSNCTFRGCNGAIGLASDVFNCTFMNCSHGVSRAYNIVNCTFRNCSYGIFRAYNNIVNCTFVNLFSNDGNAIHIIGQDNVTIDNCCFVNCSGHLGGAIYLDTYDYSTQYSVGCNNCIIHDCSFINCSSISFGGAISIKGDNNLIDNCSFIDCSGYCGGAISFFQYYNWAGELIVKTKNCVINHSNFVNCSADNLGGAIFWWTDNGRVENSNFTKSQAKMGGAVYVYDNYSLILTASNFESNKAEETGGAIYGGTILDCQLNQNSKPEIYSTINYEEIIPEKVTSNDDGIITLVFPSNAEGTLTVFINGTSYKVFEIVGGILKIDLSQFKGKKLITFEYSGDNNYPAFIKNTTATINVNKANVVASNAKVLYTAGQTYIINVYSDINVLADNANVVVKVNNKLFKILTTSAKGIASFKVMQVPGTYYLTITSLGKTITRTLTVKHLVTLKSVTVKQSAKKLTLQATLGKVNGKYLKNKKITFKFNGKKYTAKTNKKGVAKVTIKSSVLKKLKVGKKVTYQATYLKDTVKKTVKVKK